MSRIEWTRRGPDEIEEAVSMFICRLYPSAFRVRASRGDGGIDVCVPTAPNHFDIYQVKKFSSNLTSSQKKQAEGSHKRIAKYAAGRGWVIDNWYLTLPLDPTTENLTWLAAIAKSGTFPCEWRGLSHVDGWAAQFPEIVDYYFESGKARLNEDLARFTAISGVPMSENSPVNVGNYANLTPSDVLNGITQLRETLNSRDPHYLYDFAVTGSLPMNYPSSLPATLAVRAVQQVGESYVTFDVHARCAESLNERPITARMTLIVESGSENERELKEYIKFGRVPRGLITVRDMEVDMPGGLGRESAEGKIRILEPDMEAEVFERRLEVLSPDDEVIASIELKMYPPLKSSDGNGVSNRGTDRSGAFELETLTVLEPLTPMSLRFHCGCIEGKFPDEVEPALAVIGALRGGNRLRMGKVRGPNTVDIQEIPCDLLDEQQSGLSEILLRYVRALLVVQKHSDIEIRIPESIDDFNIEKTLQVAQLLKGDTLQSKWAEFTIVVSADAPDFEEPGSPVIMSEPLTLEIGDHQVDLGAQRIILESANLVRTEIDSDGDKVLTFEPALGNEIVRVSWLDPTTTESLSASEE
ncbi:hypothetical protein [Nocardia bovistercoris]|uniref:Restriction endonuclease type IV Mrr domain-containing protein n=1 Tax=Nocardia bovistercoris TaxID=2785916 RepID=A0A931I9S2_9NOCA|nr:hypothetical protein [Nocardia bovistercoris]MBH0776671.1 hypothetical protein [Nocardia bovistercoris]